MRPRLFSGSKWSFTTRVYVRSLLVLIVGFLILSATTWAAVQSQIAARADSDANAALDRFQEDVDQEMQDLEPVSTWIGEQKAFGELVQARDTDAITQFLNPLIQANIANEITVTDAQGTVLARLRVDEPASRDDNILNQPGVTEALHGTASSGLEQDALGHLQGVKIVPIYAGQQTTIAGVLMVSFNLDGELAKTWSKEEEYDFALVYHDRVMISNLDDPQGKPWQGQLATTDILEAERTGVTTDFLTLDTNKGPYLFKFAALRSPVRSVIGMLGVGIPAASISTERLELFGALSLAFLIMFLGISLLGLFVARSYTSPVRALSHAVHGIAAGNLNTPIEWKSTDEIGELASQMDCMRLQLQQVVEAKSAQESLYAAVIRDMGAAAVITDDDGKIKFVNKMAETLLGRNGREMVGTPWQQVFKMDSNPDDAIPLSWNLKDTSSGATPGLVVRGRFPLQARPQVVVDMVSSALQVWDEPAGYVHVLRDATDEERISRTKDDYLLNVAHELRGPLASLRVSIDLLTEDYTTMGKRDIGVMLKSLRKTTLRFQTLIESLIDVGNVQAGRFRVRPLPTPIGKIVRDAVERTEPLRQAHGQSLELDLEPGVLMAMADPPRVTQVLVNLLTNASKYGPEDRPITFSACREDHFVKVSVTDHGVGIPPEEQQLVFKRFFRAKRVEEEGAGIGVGLALAKEIVEAHGGDIHLESGNGAGTTFWFRIPLAAESGLPDSPWCETDLGGSDEDSIGG